MIGRELDGLEVDILARLLENGEQRFIEIAEAVFPKYAKAFHHDENHFKVVLVRKLNSLMEDDLVQKRILSPKNVRYSIPNEKREQVVKMVKHHQNIEEIKKLPPEEIERLVRENQRLKRLNRIHELEEYRRLPLWTIIKKLVDEYGFKIEDFYDEHHLKDPEFQQMFKNFYRGEDIHISCDKLTNYFMGRGLDLKTDRDFSPNEIEIKLIPENEVEGLFVVEAETGKKKKVLTNNEVWRKYGSGWIILADEPIRGYYIIGAWKELLNLYVKQFEDEWLKWKEEFNISDEDWQIVGPQVALIMMSNAGRVDLPLEIAFHLRMFIKNKNSQKLKPVKVIWEEVEEDIAELGNEEWRRIFQYLKAKYCPSS